MTEKPTPTDEQRQRAQWDLLLSDLELRAEQLRQAPLDYDLRAAQLRRLRQEWYVEPWKVAVTAITAAAALMGAGAAITALLLRWH
jgi:hypothetical protein